MKAGTDSGDQEEKTRGRLSAEEFFQTPQKPDQPLAEILRRGDGRRATRSRSGVSGRASPGVLLIRPPGGPRALCRIL